MLCAAVLALGSPYVGDAAPGIVFLIYGLTMAMLLVAIFATRMRDQPTKGANSAKLLGNVLEGLRYTLNHEGMRLVLILSVGVSLFAGPFMNLLGIPRGRAPARIQKKRRSSFVKALAIGIVGAVAIGVFYWESL